MAETEPSQPAPSTERTYLIDVESGSEMARLLDQDRLTTTAMGGLFSERASTEIASMNRILDIACGPGGWVHETAFAYPHIEVTGIDISESMIEYAQAFAQVRHLSNAHFQVMNALQPLTFADETFDLVNARSVSGVIPPAAWPQFLAECQRILKPGGTLRITESEWGFTNSASLETFCANMAKAMSNFGRGFSPTGRHLGLTPLLPTLLRRAHFEQVQSKAYDLDFSYAQPLHNAMFEDFKFLFPLSKGPLLMAASIAPGMIAPEEYDTLCEQALVDMRGQDFCGLVYLRTVWGQKPA